MRAVDLRAILVYNVLSRFGKACRRQRIGREIALYAQKISRNLKEKTMELGVMIQLNDRTEQELE